MFPRRTISQMSKTWLHRPWVGRAPFLAFIPPKPRPSLRRYDEKLSEAIVIIKSDKQLSKAFAIIKRLRPMVSEMLEHERKNREDLRKADELCE